MLDPARKAKPLRQDHLGASTFLDKGWNLMAQGDFPAAESALNKALELAPGDAGGHALLGWAQMRQGRYYEALTHLGRVLSENPTNVMARVGLGYVCIRIGHIDAGVEHLTRGARQLRDQRATLYANFFLGIAHSEKRAYSDAVNSYRTAIGLGPNFIEAFYELGRVHAAAGDRENAVRVWTQGAGAGRFSVWGKRCADAVTLHEQGLEAPSYS